MKPELLNGIDLAYLGDAVYEVFVREHLLNKGITKPALLQRHSKEFVSAKAQAALIHLMTAANFLTESETAMYKRGRNAKSYTKAKNTDTTTYRISTGFESVFGYLKLNQEQQRIAEIAHWCIDQVEAGKTRE
ncbi:Mini-ribonuclease 3 [Agrilactobacillus fermenti]|uniref:Mini-ribonuclease 3 n=1 Tax=Agrilactobacillus fermenti TaxID=2586909 RepID=UPI001E4D41C3|nr:Mini-ribonuclease 3 [Agrilactobacillus fermenti]MCD2255422.1 Mini-ribonuclease 3 [Agrilactobacillus fermenti]